MQPHTGTQFIQYLTLSISYLLLTGVPEAADNKTITQFMQP